MEKWRHMRKTLLLAVKIAVGSSAAIYIAQCLGLEYAISAGTITLLTLMTTKWETVKLSAFRLVTFAVTIFLAEIIFTYSNSVWIGYGVFIFCVVLFAEVLGWRATISVNSVIGAHLLTSHDFGMDSVRNEFLLVFIGIVIALILNLFYNNQRHRQDIISNMRYTEQQLQMILRKCAAYLCTDERENAAARGVGQTASDAASPENALQSASPDIEQTETKVWDDIIRMEKELQGFIQEAYEYQDNTFHSHPVYYIDYFEMRSSQCHVLHNLHYEVKKIRSIPKQAKVVAEFMLYIVDYVVERNIPSEQLEKLEEIFQDMKKEELPKSREEFENRAILYHILMDMEDFLIYKQRFVKSLDERQRKMYWER